MRDKNHLIMLLYYIIIIVLLFVIVISFRYPGSNLSSFSMIMTSVICLVVFMLLCRWWERIYIRVEKIEPYVPLCGDLRFPADGKQREEALRSRR